MSSTLRATTSQPRSLLSIATLNIAKSRVRPAICSLVRIDQTCFGRSGGLAPTNLPLFQGTRFGAAGVGLSLSCMVILLVCENDQHGLNARAPSGVRLLTSNRRGGCKSWRLFMTHNCRDAVRQHTGHVSIHTEQSAQFRCVSAGLLKHGVQQLAVTKFGALDDPYPTKRSTASRQPI